MIIFDLCGTLYDSNTTFDFIKYINPGKYKLIYSLPIRVISKITHIDFTRILAIYSLRGYKKEKLYQLAEDFLEIELERKKIKWTHEMLRNFKNNNEEILILTATIDPIASAISKKLGINYISTSLSYKNNRSDGKIKTDLLGKKTRFWKKEIKILITDNKDDIDLAKKSKKAYIISKEKNLSFWFKNKESHFVIVTHEKIH